MSRYSGVQWLFTWLMLVCQTGCYLLDSLTAASNFSYMHKYINASNSEQDYCERKRRLFTLSEWRLSTEKFTAALPIDSIQENYVREVYGIIFSVVYPTPFKSRVRLVAVSKEVLEGILDLDLSVSGSEDFLQLVSGAKLILGSLPLTHRYGGHQFGSWAGQLGDGRAHLIGVYTNRLGVSWELQLKGSGRTPYSRFVAHGDGDGRAVLHSSVREFLGSEAMHYLGIPTSRAASLVVSDDDVWRDRFYNGNVRKERGVCNTDNFSLLSITIDYGPFGFMDSYDPDFVPNTSDDERRYKIGNQANVGMFNLNKLLQALNLLLAPRQKQLASQILEGYSEQYYRCFTEIFKRKLGLLGNDDEDNYLIAFLLKLMEDSRADFTMTFRQLSEISQDQLKDLSIPKEFWALQDVAEHEFFSHWVNLYLLRLKRNKGDSDFERRKRMTGINPRYVLRNWMAESAAQKAEKNDFSEVRLLQQILQFPFQAQTVAERAGYAQRPPAWAQEVKISCSS
ncbi:protein adenylyltransferase SelO-like isoform X6 [Sceloporus undulatus]|uniref:protein adenylyltransferase SelO-like isoform X6 n=1 Tax=Sceloporus undulatus TaxID=8520 RepID=UPI001C4B2F32|nr:protein adenylyltransferase SelO-like isoform X6 [Sceloporus undulatus]